MEKLLKALLINIIIFSSTFISISINAELKTDDFFLYEITNTGHFIEIGKNEDSNGGFPFGANSYPIGTKVNATIEYIETIGSKFRFWIDNHSSISFFHPKELDNSGVQYGYFTLYHTYEMVSNFQNVAMVHLILYEIITIFRSSI
ncbi:MAG: hypothetical protein HZR80_02770 [Candidatus Heimdallarchaeota archaeon]